MTHFESWGCVPLGVARLGQISRPNLATLAAAVARWGREIWPNLATLVPLSLGATRTRLQPINAGIKALSPAPEVFLLGGEGVSRAINQR